MSYIQGDKVREIQLTDKQLKVFKDLTACEGACDLLVRKIVREFELSTIQLQEFWDTIFEDAGFDRKEYRGEVDSRTGLVTIIKKDEFGSAMDKFHEAETARAGVRERVRKIFSKK